MDTQNPNNGYWSPPPLVTYPTTPPAPRRGMAAWAWGLIVGGASVLALLTGVGIGAAAPAESTDAPETAAAAPATCLDALDAAEQVEDIYQDAMVVMADVADAASRSIEPAAAWDYATLDAIAVEVDGYNAELDILLTDLRAAQDDYETASAACREAGA